MSLFPAYANKQDACEFEDITVTFAKESQDWQQDATDSRETYLLASDDEDSGKAAVERARSPPPTPQCSDFYVDTKLDRGNLHVSTLYYPGRPQYTVPAAPRPARLRGRRYFHAPPDHHHHHHHHDHEAEVSARVATFKAMLTDTPHDEDLWLRFIDFQEQWRGGAAALAAATEAAERRPRARALAAARWRLARLHLPAADYVASLRAAAHAERSESVRAELWALLVAAAAAATGADARAPAAAAAAALADCARAAYPRLLFAYGSFLQSAGLWEQLVLLLELVLAMSFPPSDAFPPRPDPAREAELELRLRRYEDEAVASGLPLSTVWVRVERARAEAHWRPAAAGDDVAADPQRAPLAADVAPLLRPAGGLALLVQALRLARVPLLPATGGAVRAAGAAAADGAEALLPLLRAARRLPPAAAARAPPAAAAAALHALLDPPHYFSDRSGFLSWVNALWEAACSWTAGDERLALVCWRLRWLHALALLADPDNDAGRAELRRLRGEARGALRRHAGAAPLPFAQFARLELLSGGPAAARAAALHALRAALRDHAAPAPRRLHVARVAAELLPAAAARWALTSAVLARALPPDDELEAAPPPALIDAALQQCESRCEEIEAALAAAEDEEEECVAGGGVCAALLPAAGEWAAARALLAPPARLRDLRAALLALPARRYQSAAGERYYEQSACAVSLAAGGGGGGGGGGAGGAGRAARALAPRHPHCALLALMSEEAPVWALGEAAAAAAAARPGSECGALAALLPALVRAPPAAWSPRAARRAARAAARAARGGGGGGGGGALLHAARLEAEARATSAAPARALYAALDAAPHAKWLYVRGAQWCGGEAAALADALLDKQLRLHALREELAPPAPPAPPPAPIEEFQ
ncbi:nuclease SbcCD subunit C-like [Achroia grisella]|uniref:nuclease SbcCD subunit C-like n=1 Tax=Achroia grisella TaxID=688607 RepID=UPI0027D2C4CD|nr:nuclease SbcCD subunit C-like [Achroia grisella]